jgi:hypothetical protein
MNHLSNLPDDFCQAAFDRYWGGGLSDAAEDALTEHHQIQALMTQLRTALEEKSDVMGFDKYEDVLGSLIDAEYTDAQLHDIIVQADADAAEDEKAAAAEMRWEARRDAEGWA